MAQNRYLSNKLAIMVFISPALILFIIMILVPIVQSISMSFFEWDGLTLSGFIGFDNFIKLFNDVDFYVSFKNSIIFMTVIGVYQIGLGFVFAAILAHLKRGKKLFRTIYFIPTILSVAVVCQLWVSILDGQYGLINTIFNKLGINFRQDWLGNPDTSIFVISFINGWQFMGYHFLLIYTAIQNIPESYYENAQLVGANFWQTHFHITIPLLRETFKISLVIVVTAGFKAFEHIYILTKGGPGTASYTLPLLMLRAMFRLREFGYGCAIATVLLIECIIATIIINRMFGKERITY